MLRNAGLRKSVEQPVLDLNFAASQIGSNGAPDSRIDFSRGSNAYFVDSDGLLKKSPHNLQVYSQDFDNAAWSKARVTVSANATTAPDGTTTADKIVETAESGAKYWRDFASAVAGERFFFSVFAKAAERKYLQMWTAFGTGGNWPQVWNVFDVEAGTVIRSDSDGDSATIEDVGNGWFRCTTSITADGTGVDDIGFGLWDGVGSTPTTSASYTGDGSSGLFLWGAQFSQHSTAPVDNPYIKTEGSAVYAARLDHDPVTNTQRGLLVEEARTNLITDSESHTYFNNSNVTQTAGAALAPDGSNTAISMLETTDNDNHTLSQNVTVSDNAAVCFSFFVKANGRTDGAVEFYGAGGIFNVFNLSNGTISVGSPYSSGTDGFGGIEDYGNGWFRVHCGLTTVSGDTSGTIQIRVRDGSTSSYAGDASKGLLIWGFQVEQGSFPTSYIKTTGASVTRNADVATMGPTTGGTELVTNGTFDTDSDETGWQDNSIASTVSGGVVALTCSVQYGKFQQYKGGDDAFTGAKTLHEGRRYRASVDVTSYGSGTWQFALYDDTNTVTLGSNSFTSSGTKTFDFTMSGATNFRLWLTCTSTGTHTASFDNVSVRELYPFEQYNPSEGTMVCEFERVGNTTYDYVWSLEDGTGEESMVVLSLNATHVYFSHRAGDVNGLSFQSYGIEAGEPTFTSYAYKQDSTHIALSRPELSGIQVSFTDTSINVASVDRLGIGIRARDSAGHGNCLIKRLTYYPYRLNDDVCDSKVTS